MYARIHRTTQPAENSHLRFFYTQMYRCDDCFLFLALSPSIAFFHRFFSVAVFAPGSSVICTTSAAAVRVPQSTTKIDTTRHAKYYSAL